MSLMNDPAIWFKDLFVHAGFSYSLSSFLSTITLVLIVIFLSWFSNIIAKAIILNVVTRVVKKTTTKWYDVFLEQKVFTRLSHFAPALVIWYMASWALKGYSTWLFFVHKLTYIYMVMIGMVVINSFIEAWHKIYKTLPIAKHRNIKGYVQLLKILTVIITILIFVSVLFEKDISTLVAGLGAIAAVLILVFRDTLLGLVASIQLSADQMLKVGDWISIPKRDVDGIVSDISLNTVKVQNFDKTIITVPTYSLVNDSFQNWKGMEEAGIRQIKRSISIDVKSVRFLDNELEGRLLQVQGLKEVFESSGKQNVLSGNDSGISEAPFFNSSRITNLGIFRFYAESFLKQHPYTDKSQTVILKHQPYTGNGLQLQINLFTREIQFVPYENLQSEIVEHLLAIMHEFGLKAFQQPSSEDLNILSKNEIN